MTATLLLLRINSLMKLFCLRKRIRSSPEIIPYTRGININPTKTQTKTDEIGLSENQVSANNVLWKTGNKLNKQRKSSNVVDSRISSFRSRCRGTIPVERKKILRKGLGCRLNRKIYLLAKGSRSL